MKKIKSVRASGYTILVEMLSQQEACCTSLVLNTNDSTQGYIKDIGPLVDPKAGFKIGDRVQMQGNYVPVPNPTDNGRKWGVVEMHSIKAFLEEAKG